MHILRTRACFSLQAVFAVLSFGLIQAVAACPIPVFQYSLEYWDPDPYEVVVHYNGEFTEQQQEAVDLLRLARREKHANISLAWRDYSQAAVSPPTDRELPFIELRYPAISGIRGVLWYGALEKDAVESMLHSPLRQKIAEKLLERHAGVWVFLESGNRTDDRKALETLEKELERLEKVLQVPDPMETYGIDLGEIYTDIDFAMFTLSRDDPEEQMFIKMLLGTERDLEDFSDKPMVFPIYGRGLILYALVGAGINPWTMAESGAFLTGPCSCQVKASNPGTDILMSLDWDSQVEQLSTYGFPGSPDAGGFLDRMDEAGERLEDR